MNKKVTILCAMENGYEADIFMGAVERSLQAERVAMVLVNRVYKIIETRHTRTAFMWDIRQQPLDGVRADALFGKEPFKQAYKDRLASDAPYDMGMGLFEYICAVENKYNMIEFAHDCYKEHPEWFTTVTCTRSDSDLATARGGSRNWYYGRWQKFMEELEKEPKIKPFSRKDEEAMYIKQDVEMTNFVFKNGYGIKPTLPEIKNVIFNDPATIVIWADGTKTVVQCQEGDIYDPEKGLAMAISKKILGNKHDYYHTFKHWLKRYKKPEETTEVTCYVDGKEFTKAVWTNEEDK